IRVRVIPAHELGCRVASGKVFARNSHLAIRLRSCRINDLVIMLNQISMSDVTSKLDVAEIAKVFVSGDLIVDLRYRFDLRMIRRNATALQPVRGEQTFKNIDLDDKIGLFLKMFGGIKCRWT